MTEIGGAARFERHRTGLWMQDLRHFGSGGGAGGGEDGEATGSGGDGGERVTRGSESSSRGMCGSLTADVPRADGGCNGYMDDFSTWVLISAPVTGILLVAITALAALAAHA